VVGEKKGPGSPVEEVRPHKNARIDTFVEGLHRLHPGVPAKRLVLPAAFAHGGNMFDGSTEVVVLKLIKRS
jgi:hypothetical protein